MIAELFFGRGQKHRPYTTSQHKNILLFPAEDYPYGDWFDGLGGRTLNVANNKQPCKPPHHVITKSVHISYHSPQTKNSQSTVPRLWSARMWKWSVYNAFHRRKLPVLGRRNSKKFNRPSSSYPGRKQEKVVNRSGEVIFWKEKNENQPVPVGQYLRGTARGQDYQWDIVLDGRPSNDDVLLSRTLCRWNASAEWSKWAVDDTGQVVSLLPHAPCISRSTCKMTGLAC